MKPIDQELMIREARTGDAVGLSALLDELGFPASPEEITTRLETFPGGNDFVLVGIRNDLPVGLLTVHVMKTLHRPTPVGRLTTLVVKREERGQGVGRSLVVVAEHLLAARGCALVEVTSNFKLVEAHQFYKTLGYEATSFRFGKILSIREDPQP